MGVITPTVGDPGPVPIAGAEARPTGGATLVGCRRRLPRPCCAVRDDRRSPPDGDDWAYEMKWDGYRAIVESHDGWLRIASRRGLDVTATYPELARAGGRARRGRRRARRRARRRSTTPGARASSDPAARAPASLHALRRAAHRRADVTRLAWQDRRRLLERLGAAGRRGRRRRRRDRRLRGDARRSRPTLGLEGVVAKRVDSPYRPGTTVVGVAEVQAHRSTGARRRRVAPGRGPAGRHGRLAARRVLRRRRACGTRDGSAPGSERASATRSRERSGAATPRPFVGVPRIKGAVWVEPDTVIQVKFTEWTDDGVLRQPVFLGLRDDKDPADVVRDVTRHCGSSRRDSFQVRKRSCAMPSGPVPSPCRRGRAGT